MSPGAVEYLLRGSGCAEHEHAGEASARGGGRTADAVGYLVAGAEKEPAGVWGGEGLPMVGAQAGAAATEAEVRAVFGRLEHPTQTNLRTGEAVPLGSRPPNFDSRNERVAQALAAEPDATEERKAEIREKSPENRHPVAYYDLTFSPVKSGSVYWAGLLETGRDAEAANVVEAHRAAVAAAIDYVEEQVGSTCGRAITARPPPGSRSGSRRRPARWCGSAGTTRPACAPATPAPQPRDGAQPGGDGLRRGDARLRQRAGTQADQAGR